ASGWASKVTSGADENAASALRSSVRRSGVRMPWSATAGTRVVAWEVDSVQIGTTGALTSFMRLLVTMLVQAGRASVGRASGGQLAAFEIVLVFQCWLPIRRSSPRLRA